MLEYLLEIRAVQTRPVPETRPDPTRPEVGRVGYGLKNKHSGRVGSGRILLFRVGPGRVWEIEFRVPELNKEYKITYFYLKTIKFVTASSTQCVVI